MTTQATRKKTIEFKPAVREDVGLWIQLIGGSGSGKTYTAMRLASGIAGDRPFAVIDTENRRALHYADQFKFHHAELHPPFRPSAYAEAIAAADEAGYPVIVIDSGSHVWAGEGGVLDWHEEILDKRAGDDWKRREALKMTAWIEPKMDHKKMVQKLLQVKAHIILCLRAEEKVEMVKVNGKLEVQKKQSLAGKDGWIPVCDKSLPFEATCSFLLLASEPGIPNPIKLQEQHKSIFTPGQHIDESAGRRLAEWAKGGQAAPPASPSTAPQREELRPEPQAQKAPPADSAASSRMIEHFSKLGVSLDRVLASAQKQSVEQLTGKDLATLRSAAERIKGGTLSIDQAFPIAPTPEAPDASNGPSAAESQLLDLRAALADLGVDDTEIATRIKKLTGKEAVRDLTPEEYAKVNASLGHLLEEKRAKGGRR